MLRLSPLALALGLIAATGAFATTYLPVTFGDLITRADLIFVGEVADVRSFPTSSRDGTVIKTRVVFRVTDALWGTTGIVEVLEFLGGEWNGLRMEVAEMPQFAVGDRRVVFARRERSINPIVGFTQGLLQIRRDAAGTDRVLTLAGVPLSSPERVGLASPAPIPVDVIGMRLSDFRASVVRSLAGAGRK